MKEYLSATEVAKLWGCSRQYIQQLISEGKFEGVVVGKPGQKSKIPIKAIFKGHEDILVWDIPYKDGEQWKIKSRTKDGEHTHKIQEGE